MFCIIPLQIFGNSDVYKRFIQLNKLDLFTEDEIVVIEKHVPSLLFVPEQDLTL